LDDIIKKIKVESYWMQRPELAFNAVLAPRVLGPPLNISHPLALACCCTLIVSTTTTPSSPNVATIAIIANVVSFTIFLKTEYV
jgi:hypothetical protein